MSKSSDPTSIALIEAFYNAGKPVAAVCHAPGVLHRVKYKGEPISSGDGGPRQRIGGGGSVGRFACASIFLRRAPTCS